MADVQRVNVRPFATTSMELGATPSVLALSNGRGDIRDAVIAVFLDDRGNVRQQTKFDNLRDEADREAFIELVMRRKVKVVAVGGMSVQAARLRTDAATALREVAIRKFGENPPVSDMFGSHEDYKDAEGQFDERLAPLLTPLIVPNDATARMYMESDEAKLEHPNLPATGRYALALARFVQNPLNAYAKLGRKILDVTFLEHYQRLVSLVGLRTVLTCRSRRKSCSSILSVVWSIRSAVSASTWPSASAILILAQCCRLSLGWDRARQTFL